ncbi:hypothetical protein ACOSQ3_030052 [Xanthoceras sorbifolium]
MPAKIALASATFTSAQNFKGTAAANTAIPVAFLTTTPKPEQTDNTSQEASTFNLKTAAGGVFQPEEKAARSGPEPEQKGEEAGGKLAAKKSSIKLQASFQT